MSQKSVLCIATSRDRAEQIIANFRSGGFSKNNLSLICPSDVSRAESQARPDPRRGSWGAGSATVGGAQEGASAWYNELGTLVFADGGRFTAAGPLLAALGGVAKGATNASMAASLIRLGVPVSEARQYESRLEGGSFLLAAFIGDAGELPRAKGILSESYGENICLIDLVLAKELLPARHGLMQG